ncbi:MAG: Ferredoxin [Methanomassiliicoccales archaeon PtaU1.Bin030]|jgi:ferredoxin|nr:MAG: Ferredoxin [Methanomassiliicoccales archaeon PtaU1.Bin030]
MTMIVVVDQGACIQCGLCYLDNCPEVFKEGSDGTSEIAEQYRTDSAAQGEVPSDLTDCAKNAADACPATAISVLDLS